MLHEALFNNLENRMKEFHRDCSQKKKNATSSTVKDISKNGNKSRIVFCLLSESDESGSEMSLNSIDISKIRCDEIYCEEFGCHSKAYFNICGSAGGRFCDVHKKNGMVRILGTHSQSQIKAEKVNKKPPTPRFVVPPGSIKVENKKRGASSTSNSKKNKQRGAKNNDENVGHILLSKDFINPESIGDSDTPSESCRDVDQYISSDVGTDDNSVISSKSYTQMKQETSFIRQDGIPMQQPQCASKKRPAVGIIVPPQSSRQRIARKNIDELDEARNSEQANGAPLNQTRNRLAESAGASEGANQAVADKKQDTNSPGISNTKISSSDRKISQHQAKEGEDQGNVGSMQIGERSTQRENVKTVDKVKAGLRKGKNSPPTAKSRASCGSLLWTKPLYKDTTWGKIYAKVNRYVKELQKCRYMLDIVYMGGSESNAITMTAEIKKTREDIRKRKELIKAAIDDVRKVNSGDQRFTSFTQHADENGMISVDEIHCSKCSKGDFDESHDIYLCDMKGCDRAYHLSCLDPPLTKEDVSSDPNDDWFCWECRVLADILFLINDSFEENYEHVDNVFGDEDEVEEGGVLSPGLWDDEDSDEDEAYTPSKRNRKKRKKQDASDGELVLDSDDNSEYSLDDSVVSDDDDSGDDKGDSKTRYKRSKNSISIENGVEGPIEAKVRLGTNGTKEIDIPENSDKVNDYFSDVDEGEDSLCSDGNGWSGDDDLDSNISEDEVSHDNFCH